MLTFDPSGRCMLVGSSDGVVAVWQLHVSSHTGEGAVHEEMRLLKRFSFSVLLKPYFMDFHI